MKNATLCAKNLTALLDSLPPAEPSDVVGPDDPVGVMVHSFLVWEATVERADRVYAALRQVVVDHNDLRVCLPNELSALIGENDPLAPERSQRLRAALRDLYNREYDVTLAPAEALGKREARRYIESLEGMTPYVAARTALLAFGAHGVPVDEQTRTALIEAGAADTSVEAPELMSWLERQVKASDSVDVHQRLQAWVDAQVAGGGRRRSAGKRKTSTKTGRGNAGGARRSSRSRKTGSGR